MPRGKKTPPEVVYKIITSWTVTNNYKETARDLNLPYSTVKDTVLKNKDKAEFVKLREKKMSEFSSIASEIMLKGLTLLNRRFDRALNFDEELDELIDEIAATNKAEMSYTEKQSLINKIKALELSDIKAITTAIGTLFDKKALADGKPTERTEFVVSDDRLNKIAELAGYERKQ